MPIKPKFNDPLKNIDPIKENAFSSKMSEKRKHIEYFERHPFGAAVVGVLRTRSVPKDPLFKF